MPRRLDELAAGQTQLDKDADDVAEQARELQAAKARLSDLQAMAGVLAGARATVNSENSKIIARSSDICRKGTSTAMREAAHAAQMLREEEASPSAIVTSKKLSPLSRGRRGQGSYRAAIS